MKDTRPQTVTPHAVTVLALDTAKATGWSVLGPSCIYDGGTVADVFGDRGVLTDVVLTAKRHSHYSGTPLVIIGERPFRDRLGKLSAAWWAWVDVFDALDVRKTRRKRVYPSVWRSRVLGKGWGSASRDVAREREQLLACGLLGQMLGTVDPDQAASLGVGLYALRAPCVGDVIPKGCRGEGWQPKPKAP